MERDDLFGIIPSEFTAARNALAREDPSVKGLRKPGWPLWAVNQLGRRHAKEVKALLEAGAALEKAQRAVLRGQATAADLREATRRHHDQLAKLEGIAAEALQAQGAGAGPGVTRRVRGTLHAASIGDDDARGRLLRGALEDELEPPDVLAWMAELGPLPPPKAKAKPKRDVEAERKQKEEDKARARAQAAAAKLEAKATKLEAEAKELRRKAREMLR